MAQLPTNQNTIVDGEVIEEKITEESGEVKIIKYSKGNFLGKDFLFKLYEFTCSETKKVFAAKVVEKKALVNKRAKTQLIKEIKIFKMLHHPNIIAFDHFFEDKENVYILTEMFQNQTLKELLKRRGHLTELEVQCYLIQIIKAMKYLRSHKIIHRDLKLGNLYINDKMELKLGNFILSAKLNFEGERRNTICGTPNFIAPEILKLNAEYSYEVDIWSLGVIIYTLIIGRPPFETNSVNTTYKKIMNNEYTFPQNAIISETAKDLIKQILVLDPEKRPTLDQILSHDFFNLGISIPKTLPISTLTIPPSLSYIRQFMPEANNNGIVNKRVSVIKLIDRPKGPDISTDKFIDEIDGLDTCVKKYIDNNSKYDLGYLLNNGLIGINFKDNTKIIFNPETNQFFYLERIIDKNEKVPSYNIKDCPKLLSKKVTLLNKLKNDLESKAKIIFLDVRPNLVKANNQNLEKERNDKPFTHIKKWMKTSNAIAFRLSNNIIHICFKDNIQVIYLIKNQIVFYYNKDGEKIRFPFCNVFEMTNKEIIERMIELENICSFMLKKNEQKNLEKKEDSKRMEIENDDNEEKEEDEDYIKNEIKKNYEDEKNIYIKFTSANKVTFSFSTFCKKTEFAS